MNDRDRLDGWKEIAEYLNRSVKTAQRWEAELGLPVHRVGGGSGSVFSFRSEIDVWLVEGGADRRDPPTVVTEPSPAEPSPAEPDSSPRVGRSRWGLVATAVVVVAALAWWGVRPSPAAPAAVVIRDAHVIAAIDGSGRELWRHVEPTPFGESLGNPRKMAANAMDFDGDGINEVVAVFRHPNQGEGRVVGFSSGGEILWELTVGEVISIDGADYRDSYSMWDLVPVRSGGELWLAAVANHRPWFPCVVAWIRPATGEIVGRYFNTGYIFSSTAIDLDGSGSEVLVIGGYNNLLESPIVAVLEPVEGRAISPGPETWEPSALTGSERAYLKFDASPTARTLGWASWVRNIRVHDDRLSVEVHLEADEDRQQRVYILGRDLSVQRLEFPRSYRAYHRQLRAEGRVEHEFAEEIAAGELVERLVWRE